MSTWLWGHYHTVLVQWALDCVASCEVTVTLCCVQWALGCVASCAWGHCHTASHCAVLLYDEHLAVLLAAHKVTITLCCVAVYDEHLSVLLAVRWPSHTQTVLHCCVRWALALLRCCINTCIITKNDLGGIRDINIILDEVQVCRTGLTNEAHLWQPFRGASWMLINSEMTDR